MTGKLVYFAALMALVPGAALPADLAAPPVRAHMVEWRRDFHRHPELGNREFRTAGIVAKHLRALGMEVEEKIAHTGVVALLRGGKPGPLVALRADTDALPVTEKGDLPFRSTATAEFRGEKVGVMHACGHDGHVAVLMGVAETLAGMKEQLQGSVLFVFQPAEEGAPEGEEGGAELMLKQGLFEERRPDAIFGLHLFTTLTTGTIGVRSGPMMAESDRFSIVVTGRQTHGSRPWGGIDPIATSAQIVNTLQTIVSRRTDIARAPAVVSVGAIKGGIRYNIVPDSVEMIGTVRTFETATRDAIWADIRRMSEDIAHANGATAEVELTQHTDVLVNDPALTARMRPSLEAVVGREHVVDMPFQTVAEDFAALAKQVPGLYFFVGITPPGVDAATAASNHSPEFFMDEGALPVAHDALVRSTLDFLAGGKASP
jgi:amidohydrolase